MPETEFEYFGEMAQGDCECIVRLTGTKKVREWIELSFALGNMVIGTFRDRGRRLARLAPIHGEEKAKARIPPITVSACVIRKSADRHIGKFKVVRTWREFRDYCDPATGGI